MKERNDEVINLIDLGLVKPPLQLNQRNETRSYFETNEALLNDHLLANSEQSALFGEINLANEENEMAGVELSALKDENDHLTNDLNCSNRNRKSLLRLNKFKNLSINNSVLNTRNHYEKLTDSLLVSTDSKYYGSFSRPKTSETAFNNNVITTTINDDQSIAASITSQNILSVHLKEFEQDKHLNLLGFKTILIVILSFCFLISLIYTFKVYFTLTDSHLEKYDNKEYWRMMWIVNSIVTLIVLSVGIIGLVREKVILILITSVYLMFTLLESDDPVNGNKLFNISLLTILITSVLLIVFAARLRCYAEDKLNLINKIQYAQF